MKKRFREIPTMSLFVLPYLGDGLTRIPYCKLQEVEMNGRRVNAVRDSLLDPPELGSYFCYFDEEREVLA